MSSEKQGTRNLIRSKLEIKIWREELPSVQDARPSRCPLCGAASQPVGARMQIVGHGIRKRRVVGPSELEGLPRPTLLSLRRYYCRPCSSVLVVAPRGVLPHKRFAAFAIAWALALFGALKQSVVDVRETVTEWRRQPYTVNLDWASLRRWAREVRDGKLFASSAPRSRSMTLRRAAERAAMALSGAAPPGMKLSIDLLAALGGLSAE